MKRLLTAAAAVFITALTAQGQDILVMTDGNNIEAIVTEVASSYIKYKRYDYQNGPVFTVEKGDRPKRDFLRPVSLSFI